MTRRTAIPIGAIVENGWASISNPTRVGIVIEHGERKGKMNPGPWMRLTDGKGRYWYLGCASETMSRVRVRGHVEWPDLSQFITNEPGFCP